MLEQLKKAYQEFEKLSGGAIQNYKDPATDLYAYAPPVFKFYQHS